MRYKVPQNVEREDQILWFITLRQLIILLIGGGISYILFINLVKDNDEVSQIMTVLVWIPAFFAAVFAFVKIKGMELFQVFLLIMEHGFFRYPKRYWIAGTGEPFISMTTRVTPIQKTIHEPEPKNFDPQKAKKLADFLDRKTYYSHNGDEHKSKNTTYEHTEK